MHEIGHNLDLAHSGERNDEVDTTYPEEYRDTSCIMGLAPYDAATCFNGAKSVELGMWTVITGVILHYILRSSLCSSNFRFFFFQI